MESQSFLLSVWFNSLAVTGSFCPQHASRLNERDPSNTEKYWRDFDVSCKPWRDLKHVWHWYGTNCTKLQRSTGTKSCRQSLALPFELMQPEPSETFSNNNNKKNPPKLHWFCFPSASPEDSGVGSRADSSLLLDFQNHLTQGLCHSKWWGQSPNPAAGHHGLSAWFYSLDIVHIGSTCSIKSINWKTETA